MTEELQKIEPRVESLGEALVRLAMDKDCDPAKFQALVAVREQLEAGEAKKQFALDYAAFQAEAPIIAKMDRGEKAAYAKIDRIWRETRPLRKKYGLSVLWSETNINDEKTLCRMKGMLIHRMGHSTPIAMDMPIPGEIIARASGASVANIAQRFGMAITYCQRRGECAILGIVTGEDDDGACGGRVEPPATKALLAELRAALKETGRQESAVCEWLNVPQLEDASEDDIRKALAVAKKPKVK